MTPTTMSPDGLTHGVGFYSSDEEFVRTFVPYCMEGLERGDATVVRLEAGRADLLRSVLGEPADIEFLAQDDEYAHAPGAMASALNLIDSYTRRGAKRVRLLGQLPVLSGLSRDAWIRYEAAANHVLSRLPVDALCVCDRRTVSDAVHAELLRTHHLVVTTDGGRSPSTAFERPHAFVAGRTEVVRDALEDQAPGLEWLDPTPSDVRQSLGDLARGARVETQAIDAVVLAVSEVLGNAIMHGSKPVVVRAWASRGRVLVAVHDSGTGPADPFVGVVPIEPGARTGGLGLWIAHQLCPEIALSTDADGFTVRLAAGARESLVA